MLVYLIIFFIKIILLSFFLYKKYKSKRIKKVRSQLATGIKWENKNNNHKLGYNAGNSTKA